MAVINFVKYIYNIFVVPEQKIIHRLKRQRLKSLFTQNRLKYCVHLGLVSQFVWFHLTCLYIEHHIHFSQLIYKAW